MPSRVGFDRFRFDTDTGRLWAGDREVRLTPKASAVLAALVARAGDPVSKEDLFAVVWPDTAVSDDALTTCVLELRRALEDDARQPRFIETRHRRGYRFVSPVTAVALDPQTAALPASTAVVSSPMATIAVLPFADMSPDRDHDYLCVGLADELINALTHVAGLRVAARTASFQFRELGADVRAIGDRLGVSALLEGSVHKAGDRLRINVQLVEVDTGYRRWSKRFDTRLDDVFVVQDEIAVSIAASLTGGGLTGREERGIRRIPTGNEAYEYYLRGRQYLLGRLLLDAVQMFQRATQLDAGYGPAFAGLAMAHAVLHEWHGATHEDLVASERASQRALHVTPELADAHVARGCALALSRRYEEATTAFEAAIDLNPSLFEAHYYFARSCFAAGDVRRSVELFRRAGDVNLDDFQSPILAAQSLRVLGEAADARTLLDEGVRRAERALQINPRNVRALSLGCVNLFHQGQVSKALDWCQRSLQLGGDEMATLLHAALLHALLKKNDTALDFLERAFERGWGQRDWIERDPDYDGLRDEPRFKRLLAKLK